MKKMFYAISALGCIAFFSVGCKKSHSIDCTASAQKIATTGTAYSNDPSTANCKAYKAALQDYINSSCAGSLTAQQKAEYQESLDATTCP